MKTTLLPICSILLISSLSSFGEETTPIKSVEVASAKPEVLIQNLYKTEGSAFLPVDNKELSAKYLASMLIQLLVLDAKRSEGEVGAIDFDVLSFSQDERKITKFATQSEVKGDTAEVKASFENHGERIVIKFQCVIEADQWRIADVTYEDGTCLVKLLTPEE
jgi:hypothetical protein